MSASEDAPIIRLANSILGLAIKQGSSDIHIEPMEGDVTVRFRIDGVLQVVQKLPKRVQLGAHLAVQDPEPARHRRKAAAAGRPHQRDHGGQADRLPRVDRAGQVGREGRACASSTSRTPRSVSTSSIIARAGAGARARDDRSSPTASSTSPGRPDRARRRRCIRRWRRSTIPGVNISTAEDPIEYDLPGVTQIQVNVGHRPDVRQRAARVSAPGSRRAARRRDARQGNGAHRRRSRADRPPRVHDAPHQQRRGGVHAAAARWGSSRSSCRRRRSASSRSGWRGGCASSARSPYAADANDRARSSGCPTGTTLYRARGCAECGGKGRQGPRRASTR